MVKALWKHFWQHPGLDTSDKCGQPVSGIVTGPQGSFWEDGKILSMGMVLVTKVPSLRENSLGNTFTILTLPCVLHFNEKLRFKKATYPIYTRIA